MNDKDLLLYVSLLTSEVDVLVHKAMLMGIDKDKFVLNLQESWDRIHENIEYHKEHTCQK